MKKSRIKTNRDHLRTLGTTSTVTGIGNCYFISVSIEIDIKREKNLILSDDDDLFYGEAGECCQLNAKICKSAKTESKHSNISYFLDCVII